jgi:Family of unknown function (DUF6152)
MAMALFVCTVSLAFAHHSMSQYEPDKTILIEGTLTKATWSNPHVILILQGKPVGSSDAVKDWLVEGPIPRQLEARGWNKTISKAGDTITFEGHPRRDGSPELLLLGVTLADGRAFSFKPQ